MKTKIKAVTEMLLFSGIITGLTYAIFGLYALKVGHPIW